VTHQQVFPKQAAIKSEGLCCFLEKQHQRIGILKHYLEHYDDGRSKGFFCLATALFPIEHLIKTEREVGQTAHTADVKSRCKALRTKLEAEADNLGIELKLRTKA
jgi:hypothetical protein